ncbi:hypothetical protein DL98DRAFT_197385 [Cadophora sp. DSE1049]|nr:hypothetical protein DL98DRAFT_197385 [Cadophora sp. DSE1049]
MIMNPKREEIERRSWKTEVLPRWDLAPQKTVPLWEKRSRNLRNVIVASLVSRVDWWSLTPRWCGFSSDATSFEERLPPCIFYLILFSAARLRKIQGREDFEEGK